MFTFGTVAGWQLNEWKRKRKAGEWWESLGVKMSLLNYDIKETSLYDLDAHALNGKIDVVRIEAKKRGLAFPLYRDGFTNADQLTPYLARVSVLLEAGNVKEAKQLASSMSKAPSS